MAIWLGMGCLPAHAAEPLLVATLAYPPYIKQTHSGAEGLAVDLVREIFSRMGRPIRIEFYPWARALHMLNEGSADALFTIKKTPERERTMRFPKTPLFYQDYVFFVPKGSKFQFDGNFASLAEARIGVVHQMSYGQRFDLASKAGAFKNVDPANNLVLTFRKLLGGRVDAVICSRWVGLEILKSLNALDQVQISGPPSETAPSYLVFSASHDSASLVTKFERAMATMQKDGTLQKLLRKYPQPEIKTIYPSR